MMTTPGMDSLAMLLKQKGDPIPVQTGVPWNAQRWAEGGAENIKSQAQLRLAQKAAKMAGTQSMMQGGVSLAALLAMLYKAGAFEELGSLFGSTDGTVPPTQYQSVWDGGSLRSPNSVDFGA